jgi:hypothetical protein
VATKNPVAPVRHERIKKIKDAHRHYLQLNQNHREGHDPLLLSVNLPLATPAIVAKLGRA